MDAAVLAVAGLRKSYRRQGGAGGGRPRGRGRRAGRPARPQRRRQVDPDEDRLRPGPAERRRRRGAAARRPARRRRGPRSATSPSSSASPAGARPTSCCALHQRLCRLGGRRRPSAPSCSSWSSSATPPASGSRRCRRGCSSGSGSPRRWSARRGCCCSTSRPARSTRSGGASSAACSRSCAAAASPCCSTRTCSARSSWSATGSRSSPDGKLVQERAARRSSRGRGGVEVETASGRQASSRAPAARRRREIVARAGRRGRAHLPGRGAASSSLEDVYLEAVGGRPDDARRRCARSSTVIGYVAPRGAAPPRLPRRPGAHRSASSCSTRSAPTSPSATPSDFAGGEAKILDPQGLHRRDDLRPGDVRHALPRRRARRLPHARRRARRRRERPAAAARRAPDRPHDDAARRASLGAARPLGRLRGRSSTSAAWAITWQTGALVARPPARAGPGAGPRVAIIAALSLLASILLSVTAQGIVVFMVFGAGLTAGLLAQIGNAINSDTAALDRPTSRAGRCPSRGSTPPACTR